MITSLPQNPQTIGDIVGKSVQIVREHAPLMISALLWPSILTCAAMSGCRVVLSHWLRLQSADLVVGLQHGSLIFIGVICFSYAQWELMVRGLAIMRFCIGYCASYKEACNYATRRWFALVVIYSIAVGLPVGVSVFWSVLSSIVIWIGYQYHLFPYGTMLPFAIIGLFSTLSLAWSFLLGSMMLSVLACEDLSLKQVIRRGKELSFRYLWRGGSFMCFLGIVLIILSLALDVPLIAVSLIDVSVRGGLLTQGPVSMELPLYLEILTAFWGGILNLVLLSVALIADALYYHDICLRLEGTDIKSRLKALN